MIRKKLILMAGFLLVIGLFAGAGSAQAGGWATLTLSELPQEVVAERPFTVEFSVRGHGQTLLSGLDFAVTAVHEGSDTKVVVQAEDGFRVGYYVATLTLPLAGEWLWEIGSYPMPPLTVNEAAVVSNNIAGEAAIGATAVAWQLVMGWAAAAGAFLLLYFWTQQKSRPRLAGVIVLGVISLVGFGLYWQMPQAVQAENEAAVVPAIAPEAMGEALFVAKGCIQCHTNDNVTMAENLFPIGPDVTFSKRSGNYLQLWLANPPDLKAGTQMPNLHLSEAEIDTLVTFLKQD